jgi:hypothetical protein
MDLERVAAVIRPRSYWESVDLGFCMVRAWRVNLFAAWLSTALPVSAALCAALWNHPSIAGLLVWWLKPLFDRVPLYVLSRALFGSIPGTGEVLTVLPALWRRNFLSALTIFRLDPARSFNLPVWQLEGLRGRARMARSRVLEKGCYGEACTLMGVCAAFEGVVSLGVVGLAIALIPHPDPLSWLQGLIGFRGAELTLSQRWLLTLPSLVAMLVIEPFYVAGGFGLYLNRRTRLEAWDVEIAFRRMARRLEAAPRRAGPAISLTSLVLAAGLAIGSITAPRAADGAPSIAGETGSDRPVPARPEGAASISPEEAIRQVLGEPEFRTVRHRRVWRLKGMKIGGTEEEPAVSPFLQDLGRLIAAILQPLLWIALLALLAVLLHRARRGAAAPPRAGPRPARRVPESLAGLDVRPDALPADVASAARGLWMEGRQAEALSLLYRGALARLVTVEEFPLKRSFTEEDCLACASKRLAAGREIYFRDLTESWQAAAYAGRPPDHDRAMRLLDGWPLHFGASP